MAKIDQSDEEIKITIEINRDTTKKPDIVLMPTYIKFNSHPIFFERHLMHEIDETASFCRIIKNEARIVLIKKHKGIWPELFQTLSKEELFQKRMEISDKIVERNKEQEKQAIERYERKKRSEIDKEVQRENAMRERFKQFEQNACNEMFTVKTEKEKDPEEKYEDLARIVSETHHVRSVPAVRNCGKINIQFSNYNLRTPKRQSQEEFIKGFNKDMQEGESNE